MVLLSTFAFAQTSNVTATLTDPDGQTWNDGTYTINFVPTPGVPGPFTWNGGQSFTKQYTGSFSNLGVLAISLPSSNFIAPAGSTWRFTLCPNASFQCTDVVLPVTGAAPNLSVALSSLLPAIRFAPGLHSFGYLDVEVGTPAEPLYPGALYWNVTSSVERQWTGVAWINFAGSSGGTVTTFSVVNSTGGLLTTGITNPTINPQLTLSLPNAGANLIWGNCTGAPAPSAYCAITTGMLPFTYSGNTTELATVTGAVTTGHCSQFDASGNLVDSGGGCSGAPGGINTQVQYNNAGAFAGIANVAAGSLLASAGVGTAPSFQTKAVMDVRDFTGATNNAALTNAIATVPVGGSIIQNTAGAQSWTACPTFGSNPVHLILSPGTITVSANCTIPSNVVTEFKRGAILKPAASVAVTLTNPPIADSMQQIYDISNASAWVVNSTGDIELPWYGVDCAGVVDAGSILNKMTNTVDRLTGRYLDIPKVCHVVTESTWIVQGQESLAIEGHGVPGISLGASISGRTSGSIITPISSAPGIPLSRAGWTASADSENTETPVSDGFPPNPPSNVLDGNTATYWLTCYLPADCTPPGAIPPVPHYIRIDMGAAQNIAQVAVLPRQDLGLGRFTSYDVQTSTNAGCAAGAGFSSQTTGVWDGSPAVKVANFPVVSARCFEIIANGSLSNIYGAAAEVNASTASPAAWTATADSAQASHPASFLIDGVTDDPTLYDRYWSTAFSGIPGYPHYVIIDMQTAQNVAGLAYTPRQANAANGFIAGYDIQTSTNAGCAGNVGFSSQTTGTWAYNMTTKVATWTPASARCVKLVATSSGNGNATAAGVSIQLFGSTGVPQIDGGPVILQSRSGYSLIRGLTVEAKQTGASSNFTQSIQTLNVPFGTTASGYTSTHNTYEFLRLTTNLGGGTVPNYKGFYIHDDANQEMFTLRHVGIQCNNAWGSYGFISDDVNADSTRLDTTDINNCMRGVGMIGGITYIHGGNLSTNGGFSNFGVGGGTIYELGAGCVAEMSDIVAAEGSGQILNTGKDQISAGCSTVNQNFHDNQLSTPDIDPAVYPINFTSTKTLRLCGNAILSSPATVHNSRIVGTDQTSIFGTIGKLYDCGDNILSSPNLLSNVPFGGSGEFHQRLSTAFSVSQGYSTYSNQLIPAIGPGNGARAIPSPFMDISSNIFHTIVSTPQQETFSLTTAPAADGIHSTFAFTEKGVTGAVGGAHQYAFDAPLSGLQLSPVTQPAADGITVQGTSGATSYGYKIECLAGAGHCAASVEVTTATGNATLGSPNCNLVSWRPAGAGGNVGAGAWGYKLFRTTCGGAGVCSGGGATGLITTLQTRDLATSGDYLYQDCGTAGDAASPDVTNTTGQLVSTVATGLAPIVVASTTNIPNLNASSLSGATFAAPGAIGGGTPNTAAFTTVTATSYTSSASDGGVSGTEGTGASVPAGAGLDVIWPDSTAHRWKMNNNNGTNQNVLGSFASGNVTTAGTAVTNGTCQAQTGITVTGALTSDNVVANIGAALPATWQTGIVLSAHVTAADTVTVYLCNPSAGSITPAATQVNVRIVR